MADYYLEFEKPIQEIDLKILELEADTSSADHSTELSKLKTKRNASLKEIFSGLSRWQRVQLARHPQRPFSLDYIQFFSPDFIELHGDRYFSDDSAVICGIGSIEGVSVMFIGQQKGRNTKDNLFRNFGMSRPEGYRKALRLMKLAEKYNIPVLTLIDTPGAYPGLGAEERGQAEAIARNLFEMAKLRVPIINIVIGEGASGGALGIGVGDRILCFENTWYSVISPEGCATILFRDASRAPEAADSMMVTAKDLMDMGIADTIMPEPIGGTHQDYDKSAETLKDAILESFSELNKIDPDKRIENRIEKYEKMGKWSDG